MNIDEFSQEILDPGEVEATGKRGEFAVTKPQGHLRKHPNVKELSERSSASIPDLSGKHDVRLQWNLNEQANRDTVFKLTVDDKEVYLDLDELLYYTRVMFN